MKALTVQQPWAWAIIHGGKDVENRTQPWSYRGPLLIHGGLRWSQRGEDSPLVNRAWWRTKRKSLTASHPLWHPVVMQMGALIGVVDLVDVHPDENCCRPWGESSYDEHGGSRRRDVTHLILENPRPLAELVYCRGSLGLWTPPPHVLDQIPMDVR